MKKRFFIVLMICLLSLSSAFAGDYRFIFKSADLNGIIPSFAHIGVGYDGLKLNEEEGTTSIELTLGGGVKNKYTYGTSSKTGNFKVNTALATLSFSQGFYDDVLTPYIGVEVRGENYVPVAEGSLPSLDEYSSYHYRNLFNLFTTIYGGVVFDKYTDKGYFFDGYHVDFDCKVNSSKINKDSFYITSNLSAVFGRTFYQQKKENGFNLVSVSVVDRVSLKYTKGTKVPVYVKDSVSLGSNVRGFAKSSFYKENTFVNNLDLRIAGPEFYKEGLFPSVNVFFDYGCSLSDSQFVQLSSVGVQACISLFDFIDVGYQAAYLLEESNLLEVGKKVTTGVVFGIDF